MGNTSAIQRHTGIIRKTGADGAGKANADKLTAGAPDKVENNPGQVAFDASPKNQNAGALTPAMAAKMPAAVNGSAQMPPPPQAESAQAYALPEAAARPVARPAAAPEALASAAEMLAAKPQVYQGPAVAAPASAPAADPGQLQKVQEQLKNTYGLAETARA